MGLNTPIGPLSITINGVNGINFTLPSGTGLANQMTFWTGTNTLAGDTGFVKTGTGATFFGTLQGGLNLGLASTTTGSLVLFNSGSAFGTTLQSAALAAARTYVWPLTDPTAGQVLSATAPAAGIVTMSWSAAGSGTVTGSGVANQISFWTAASAIGGDTGFIKSGTGATFFATMQGGVNLGLASTTTGSLVLFNSGGANGTTFQSAAIAAARTYTWPLTDPTAGQVLSATAPAAGVVTLSWATAGGGTPAGVGTELQSRLNATTFQAVPNSLTRAQGFGVGTPTTADAIADSLFAATATTQTALVVQAKAVPTTDFFRVEDSLAAGVFRVQSDGGVLINQKTGATFSQICDVQFQGVRQFSIGSTGTLTVVGDITFLGIGTVNIGGASQGAKRFYADFTNTATVGAVTINKMSGRVNIAAAGTSVVVTNNLVTAASHVIAVASQNDTTARVTSVVPAAGSFTINTAATTAQTSFDFLVINAD